jgi:hypothetical protein
MEEAVTAPCFEALTEGAKRKATTG